MRMIAFKSLRSRHLTRCQQAGLVRQFTSQENYFPVFESNTRDLQTLEPVCPHCGLIEQAYKLTPKAESKKGTHIRKGVWKCAGCRKEFTVTVGTIFEDSHIPLHKWLFAYHLLCASKKGMSAHQLQRMLGVTYRSAWFMAHRDGPSMM